MRHWLFPSLVLPALLAAAVPATAAEFPTPEESKQFFDVFRAQNVGEAPAPVPADWREESSEPCDGYTRKKISYQVEAGERVTAWLLIPDHRPGDKLPLVFCLHPTFRDGKDIVLGKVPPKNDAERRKFEARSYALELVERGFICFAPDRAGFGERSPNPTDRDAVRNMRAYNAKLKERHPGWHHIFGKVPYDLSRALDFLVTFPEVDPDNIGAIGHSLGGWDALYFYGSDPRVRAAVSNSGGAHNFIPKFWTDQKTRLAYAEKRLQLKPETDSAAQVYLMMGAPRAFLYLRSVKDSGTDYQNSAMEAVRLASQYFAALTPEGAKPQLAFFFHNEGHDFPAYARDLAYRWLETQLKRR